MGGGFGGRKLVEIPAPGATGAAFAPALFLGHVFRSLFEEKWSPKGIPFGSKIDKNGVQKHTFSGYLKKSEKVMIFEGPNLSKT